MRKFGRALVDANKKAIVEDIIIPFNQIFDAYPPVDCAHFQKDTVDATCPACQQSEANRQTRERLYAALWAPAAPTQN